MAHLFEFIASNPTISFFLALLALFAIQIIFVDYPKVVFKFLIERKQLIVEQKQRENRRQAE